MSSPKTTNPHHGTRTPGTRGTYMSHNGRNIYVETRTLEDCIVNFQMEEMPQNMYERLHEVFSTPIASEPNQIYIPIVFDYYAKTESNSEVYILSGFWNPNTSNYEFEF